MPKEDHVNQHIAPQVYLRRFAERDKDKYIIGVWQKGEKNREPKLFYNSVDNVGYIKRFYDVPNRADPKYWEKFFAEHIDPLYGAPLNTVIARIILTRPGCFQLTDNEKRLLATIVASQMLRVPRVITKHLDKAPQLLAEWKREFLDTYDGLIPARQEKIIRETQYTKDEIKDIIIGHITDEKSMERYISMLQDRLWLIYINNTHFPFITSDSPVLQYNICGNSLDEKDTGIARLDTALIFTLTPRIMLHLVPRSFGLGMLETYNGKLMVLDDRNMKFISNYNIMQLENCYQQAFMPIEMLEIIQAGEKFVKEQNNNLG